MSKMTMDQMRAALGLPSTSPRITPSSRLNELRAVLGLNQIDECMPGVTAPDPMEDYQRLWRSVLKREKKKTTARDIDVRKFSQVSRRKLAAWRPNLNWYDLIMVNTSGGKDSTAMMAMINKMIPEGHHLRDRVVAIHSDLGNVEHHGVVRLVEQHAQATGIPVEVVQPMRRVRSEGQNVPVGLLELIDDRGKAPGFGTRFCTSALKTSQIQKWKNKWIRESFPRAGQTGSIVDHYGRQVRVLNLLGLRAAESASRAQQGFKIKSEAKTRSIVHEWLPIQFLSDEEVWETIRLAGLSYHRAYDHGFRRLSCMICPLAGEDDLALAMVVYPDMANKIIALEKKRGFKWKETKSASQILASAMQNPVLVQKARLARQALSDPDLSSCRVVPGRGRPGRGWRPAQSPTQQIALPIRLQTGEDEP